MNILVNALGVKDSGGGIVLRKLLGELLKHKENNYIFICNRNKLFHELSERYRSNTCFAFHFVDSSSLAYRIYFENWKFRKIVRFFNIDLIYNFSGTAQAFKTPQLVKIHNLLFYSKKLDRAYWKRGHYKLWLKEVFFKRLFFKFMLQRVNHIEIQSSHVSNNLADFLDIRNKTLYVKSDINVSNTSFRSPRKYTFPARVKFLYIVGPHFDYIHKNLGDFTGAMLKLYDIGFDFEINITLTKDRLEASNSWNTLLNSKTNFLGYVEDQDKIRELFSNDTILISTSVVESLGLNVIEGIKNGIITITPDEDYSNAVYGKDTYKYKIFNIDSLVGTILDVVNRQGPYGKFITSAQNSLKSRELEKFDNVVDVFDRVLQNKKDSMP